MLRLCALVALVTIVATAQLPTGVWRGEWSDTTPVSGTLTIDTAHHRAAIAGQSVTLSNSHNELRAELPNALGSFRGFLSRDSRTLEGFWIQPTAAVLFQRYATPVRFRQVGPHVWRGFVTPLAPSITFYLAFRDSKAFLRCPEFGWMQGAYDVHLVGTALTLTNKRRQLSGTYDASAHTLSLGMVEAAKTPMLFHSVPADSLDHSTVAPKDSTDWRTSSPVAEAMNAALLNELVRSIESADRFDPATVPIHSLLIARHGKLILERYFETFDAARPHDTRSAGKTIAPMLVGAARHQGASITADSRVYEIFRDLAPFASPDPRKERMTLRDIMTMTPGLACDDAHDDSPGNENTMQEQTAQPDWYKYTLDLPMVRDPGGDGAIYCSASLNLVGGAAERASGTWNPLLFDRDIAQPLGFGLYNVNLQPSGSMYTRGGSYFLPRDALKMGQLYLDHGRWYGKQIIPSDWVAESTAPHATFIRKVVPNDDNHRYGYGWHIHNFTVAGKTYREYAAEGNGGQFIMVFPELDMVVAVNGGDYGRGAWYSWALAIAPKYLIPAALNVH